MRKTLTLFLALLMGCFISHAATYRARVVTAKYANTNYQLGSELSENPTLLSAILKKDAQVSKDGIDGNVGLPTLKPDEAIDYIRYYTTSNGTEAAGSLNMRWDTNQEKSRLGSRIILRVYNKVKNVRIYFTASDNTERRITLEKLASEDDDNGDVVTTEYKDRVLCNGSSEYAHFEYIERLSPGIYQLYSSGFTGGFLGIRFEDMDSAPRITSNPGQDPATISGNKTWDLSDITGVSTSNANGSNYYYNDKNNYASYAYMYYRYWLGYRTLYYNNDFDGKTLAFKGDYAIIQGSYAQNGTLMFETTIDGYVRVTFSDLETTSSSDSNKAYRRYLAINGERTDYWTSRAYTGSDAYPANLDATSGFIPVSQGKVYISGLKEDGKTDAPIRVSKVEFIKKTDPDNPDRNGSLVGVTDDTFSQRTYYYENGKSICTWRYYGYKNQTHGLKGGVDDNGILYVSSDVYDPKHNPNSNDDNTNGNISFMLPSTNSGTTSRWLSCAYGSSVYVPVVKGSSGTISITCSQNDYKDGTGTDRYFELHKETNGNDTKLSKVLPMLKLSSMDYTKDDITELNGNYYLKLVGHYDSNYTQSSGNLYQGEMKVYTITVAMDAGFDYKIDEPETDYDHNMGEEHSHALFNWTQGDVYNNNDNTYGTLKISNGAVLSCVNESSGNTEPIHSYRNGDIVKYKTNYYGGLQLLAGAVYTITAPEGYYITSSVRIHGHNNQNLSGTDEGSNIYHDAYVSNLNMDVFKKGSSMQLEQKEMENIKASGGIFKAINDSDHLGEGNGHDDTYMKFPRDDKNARTTTLDFTTTATKSIDFKVSDQQIFAVIDAVIVPVTAVPTLSWRLFYKYSGLNNTDMSNFESLRKGGVINYTPQPNEEVWWYFEPASRVGDDRFGSRGCFDYTTDADINQYPADHAEGVKDQNFIKTFSVLNYKFVNTPGLNLEINEDSQSFSNLENNIYNNAAYYKSGSSATPQGDSGITVLADANDKVSITVNSEGKFYYFIKNTVTNFNSPLSVITFDMTTGVEDITVEQENNTDELNMPVYNIYGQRVDSNYRGIVIRNGKKFVRK